MSTASSREGKLSVTAGTAFTTAFQRGYLSAAYTLSAAGAAKNAHGTIEYNWDPAAGSGGIAQNDKATFKPYSLGSTHQTFGAVTVTAGDLLYPAANGSVTNVYTVGLAPEGIALNTTTSTSEAIEYVRVVMEVVLINVVAGSNGAGAITFTGAQIGDVVLSIINTASGGSMVTNDGTTFERVVTVAAQLQQASASDLSANKYQVTLARPKVA